MQREERDRMIASWHDRLFDDLVRHGLRCYPVLLLQDVEDCVQWVFHDLLTDEYVNQGEFVEKVLWLKTREWCMRLIQYRLAEMRDARRTFGGLCPTNCEVVSRSRLPLISAVEQCVEHMTERQRGVFLAMSEAVRVGEDDKVTSTTSDLTGLSYAATAQSMYRLRGGLAESLGSGWRGPSGRMLTAKMQSRGRSSGSEHERSRRQLVIADAERVA